MWLATTLNELAQQSAVGMQIREEAIPVRAEVAAACELLGLDPLYVANEGKLIAISPAEQAQRLLGVMRAHPLGAAAVIGEVVKDDHRFVHRWELVLAASASLPGWRGNSCHGSARVR